MMTVTTEFITLLLTLIRMVLYVHQSVRLNVPTLTQGYLEP